MSKHTCLLLAVFAMAACLSPTSATAQIYGAEVDGGDLYMFIDTARFTVNQSAQIPLSRASLTIARDCGCDVIVARRDTGEENAHIHRLNQWSQTITVIDTLDAYDEPVALCRGPGADMYIMVDGWSAKDEQGARTEENPYIGRLQDGLPPLDVIRYFDGGFTDLVDMQVWRYGPNATNVATLERRNDGVDEWWDIGEYQMSVEDTLGPASWWFGDASFFPTDTYSMTSIAILPSGNIVLASDGNMYLADGEGEPTEFGDGLGAADLEVGSDGIVYALYGSTIRRYDDAGERIYPDLTAPNVMQDLAIGDFVFTPSGPNVLIEPTPNVEITYQEGTQDGQTAAIMEFSPLPVSPGGAIVPIYAEMPGGKSDFTYVSLSTDAIYNRFIQVDVLLEGSRLFFANGVGDTFRDFTVVGSVEDARGTIPRFEELPCPGDKEGRPPLAGESEVVLVEDTRPLHAVTAYKFWRLELAMAVPDTVPPCPWGIIHDLQDHVAVAHAQHEAGLYGNALLSLALMNAELRAHEGWCVPDSSNAAVGNLVGNILAHSKTLMFSIEQEWGHPFTGVVEPHGEVALASINPAHGECRMLLTGPPDARTTVDVYDVAGRWVATVFDGSVHPGGAAIVWDGRDSAGNRVASGVYFARASVEGQSAESKVIYIK
jgi:hypothetical protein